MKAYKKALALFLALALSLSLASCSQIQAAIGSITGQDDPSVAGNKPAGNHDDEDTWTPPSSPNDVGTQGNSSQPVESQQPTAPEVSETTQPDLTGNITWTLDNYVLTVSGTGAMESIMDKNGVAPWADEYMALNTIIIEDGITTVAPGAFSGLMCAENISIPNSVTTIGDYAFSGANARNGLIIPDSVTSLGAGAFQGLIVRGELTIPGNVGELPHHVFNNCDQLTSIVILDGVTSIGSYAIGNCGKLTSVTIPDSVTYIDELAFAWTNRDLMIYGSAGSAAEAYAIADGRNFSAIG